MKILTLAITMLSFSALAGVEAYTSTGGQKLFLENASGQYFVRFTGVYPGWDNKVIQVKKVDGTFPKYEFEYSEELSSGVKTYTYGLVTEESPVMKDKTQTKRVKLWTPNERKKGTEFLHDKDLTASSQSLDLQLVHKKEKFTPEVE